MGECASIHDPSVEEDDNVCVLHLRHINEDFLQVHLKLHEILLELYCVGKLHLICVDEGPSFFENGGRFGNDEHTIAHLLQDLVKFSECGSFAGTWSSGYTDSCNRDLVILLPRLGTERFFNDR